MIPDDWKLTGEEAFRLIDGDECGGSYEDFIDSELPDRLYTVNDAAAKKAAIAALRWAIKETIYPLTKTKLVIVRGIDEVNGKILELESEA